MDTHIPGFIPSPSPVPQTVHEPTIQQSYSSPSHPQQIPSSLIDTHFSTSTNLTSTALNARILSFSDEYFASAHNLLTPTPPIHRPGHYIHTGAWYDGWETRRHNPQDFDWVVIRLGCVAAIEGVEIDTGFFVGNHAEKAALEGCYLAEEGDNSSSVVDEKAKAEGFDGWKWILEPEECGPGSRQAWRVIKTEATEKVTHLRLRMFPDGGIARLRAYGRALPPPRPTNAAPSSTASTEGQEEELTAALNGGVAIACSDQHFGLRSNLLLPGRGVDMGDGWETKRSRERGHTDWVEVKLGLAAKRVTRVVVDTKDFRGNFPRAVRVEGAVDGEGEGGKGEGGRKWVELLKGERPCRADTEHVFTAGKGEVVDLPPPGRRWTHVKLTIVPDGGVKRLRVFGERA